MRARTIAGVLRERAESSDADRVAIRFSAAGDWIVWTWRQYWAAARAAAASLTAAGVGRGDHLLVLTPEVRPAVAALFGAWTIGAVPVQIGIP